MWDLRFIKLPLVTTSIYPGRLSIITASSKKFERQVKLFIPSNDRARNFGIMLSLLIWSISCHMLIYLTIKCHVHFPVESRHAKSNFFSFGSRRGERVEAGWDHYPSFSKSYEYFVEDGARKMSAELVLCFSTRCQLKQEHPDCICTLYLRGHLVHLMWTVVFEGFEPRTKNCWADVLSTW